MADLLSERIEDGVVILSWPGALSLALCEELDAALTRALDSAEVRGLVLNGAGFGFDLSEKAFAALIHRFDELTNCIAASAKPVIAVMTDEVRNESLALCLCAQGRVADATASVAVSSVDIGLIPGGGCTQRLPRVIGPGATLQLILSGEVWPVSDTRLNGLVDAVLHGDVEMAAIKTAQKPLPAAPEQEADPAAFQDALANARARFPKPTPAQADVIACVEAAQLLPLPQGLAFETARVLDRNADLTSHLLRHSVLVKEKARQTSVKPALEVQSVVVLGHSIEAADLAAMALEQGHHVWLESGRPQTAPDLATLTKKRLRPAFRSDPEVTARLSHDPNGMMLEQADLVLDTAELDLEPQVTLKPGVAWVVTSPNFAAAERARVVGATGHGLRMRRLLRASQLVELSAPLETSEAIVATAHEALSAGDQSVIVTSDAPGGLLGALFCALARAALDMLAAGRGAGEIEQAARDLGLRQGPLQMIDVLGAGRSLAQMQRVYESRDAGLAPLRLLSDRMADVTDGNQDRARRALVFHAPAGQSFVRDPDLSAWISEWRADHPDRALIWPDADPGLDLKQAFLAALVSEAARLIDLGVVRRVSDIDLAAEKGLLMDAGKGGPLIQADMAGLLGVSRVMRGLEATDKAVWALEPLIEQMVKNGRRFF